MKLIIDIPESMYEGVMMDRVLDTTVIKIFNAIKNGIPLPKVHGRLVILSEDIVKREQTSLRFSCQNWISEVGLSNATVAIIEEDKAESEG